MSYHGKFTPKNPSKYRGDVKNIVYRSLWERQVFKFLDDQSIVNSWSSESVIIPYICKTDGRAHRYFVDIKMTMDDGRTILVEIKPEKETKPPTKPSRKTARYITEVMTYAKNFSKWKAAQEYALDRGWLFQVWNENTIRKLGIKL